MVVGLCDSLQGDKYSLQGPGRFPVCKHHVLEVLVSFLLVDAAGRFLEPCFPPSTDRRVEFCP